MQVGNPDGADKPNKKYYDPRVWIRYRQLGSILTIVSYLLSLYRAAEESMIKRAHISFSNLNGDFNLLGADW